MPVDLLIFLKEEKMCFYTSDQTLPTLQTDGSTYLPHMMNAIVAAQ